MGKSSDCFVYIVYIVVVIFLHMDFLSKIFSFLTGLSSLLGPLGFWHLALPVGVCSLECNNNNQEVIALPPKLGGMGITNPIEIASDEYENSIRLTQNLTKMIINQDRFESIDENEMNEIKKSIAKEREMKQKEQLKSILDSEDLTEIERIKIEICQEPGASNWLTALLLREAGLSLKKQECRDALAIRYNISIKGLPETCACGSELTCDHAMI